METRSSSPLSILVIAAFSLSCVGLLLYVWLSFGGSIPLKPQGYRVQVAFPEAAQLADQADVRVAGVNVGKVVGKRRDPDANRTIAELQLEPRYAPLRRDARAMLRQKTLLGETYVELTTGTRGAPAVPEGGRLPDGRVAPTVQLDELLEIFDAPTRAAFQTWQAELARASRGRAQDINDALGNLPEFVVQGTGVLEVLERRRRELRALVRNTGVTFGALTEDEAALRRSIIATTEVFDTTAARRESLADTIRIFPTFLDESRLTMARLATFAVDTEPLLRDLVPVLVDAQPTVRDLRRLAPDLQRLFRDLDPLIRAGRDGLPAMRRVLESAGPLLSSLHPFLGELNPILRWMEYNQAQVSDFLSVGPSALALRLATPNPQGRGHALPQIIVTGSQSTLTSTRSPDNRGNTYLKPGALADPRLKTDLILPNWDCVPSGGPRPRRTEQPGRSPACWIQGPIPFQGRAQRFPHIHRERYGNTGD